MEGAEGMRMRLCMLFRLAIEWCSCLILGCGMLVCTNYFRADSGCG